MAGAGLFEELAEQLGPERTVSSGAPRVQEPRRDEPSWQVVDLDALIVALVHGYIKMSYTETKQINGLMRDSLCVLLSVSQKRPIMA
jgi:hypothetical protein